MAKQKSGLGRGLNALFDESSLQVNQSYQKKELEQDEKASKEEAQNTTQSANDEVKEKKQPEPRKATPLYETSASSDIYFSEESLENAKVVEREARPAISGSQGKDRVQTQAKEGTVRVGHTPIEHNIKDLSTKEDSTRSKILQRMQQKESSHDGDVAFAKVQAAQSTINKEKDAKGTTGIVQLTKVQPNPDQPRTNFKPEEIEELAESIKKEGLLQPILVRKVGDHYQIIAGERRWQACRLLKMKEIPVRFWAADNDKALELALIENIQRTDLNPIEEAYGYKRLMERRGMTQSEVAQTVSKGRSTIANALRLLDLPEEAQQLLFEEKITAGHARAILSIPDAEGRKTLTNKLVNEKLSVRETESIARLLAGRAQSKKEESTKRMPVPASFKKAARGLTRFFSTPVKVKTVQGKNKIEIQFKDEEELERILNLISEQTSEK